MTEEKVSVDAKPEDDAESNNDVSVNWVDDPRIRAQILKAKIYNIKIEKKINNDVNT